MKKLLIVVLLMTISTSAICDCYKYIVLEEKTDYSNGDMYRGSYPTIITAKIFHSLEEVQKYARGRMTVYRVNGENLVRLYQVEKKELKTIKVWIAEDPEEKP